MSLDKASLANRIKAKTAEKFGVASDQENLDKFADIISESVIEEIQANIEADISKVMDSTGTPVTGEVTIS